jgi:DnaJ-class molecular chaperone
MACRGTGSVISRLGGEASTVTCPWCEGTGNRIPGVDAQARWTAQQPEPQTRAADAE